MIDYHLFERIQQIAWLGTVVLSITNYILWIRARSSIWFTVGFAAFFFLVSLAWLCKLLSAVIRQQSAHTIYLEFGVLFALLLAAAVGVGRRTARKWLAN